MRSFLTGGIVIPVIALAVGCNKDASPKDTAPTGQAPVAIIYPQRKALQRVVEQPGTVQAYEETQLVARVPGYVRLPLDSYGAVKTDIGYKIRGPIYSPSGTELEPGEVLAELVVPELEEEAKLKQAQARQAEAEVEQARKALAAAEENIGKMEALVTKAKALHDYWESQYGRMAQAVKSGQIGAQEGAETLNQFKAAGAGVASSEAEVRKAKADRDKAAADVRATEAHVDVAKADAKKADVMLAYSKIRAPYDGVITMLRVSNGAFVQPGAGKGDWLFTVARTDPVRVVIGVPEADAELVSEKSKVKLQIKAAQSPLVEGTVTRTSWALEPGARTLRAELVLPNKEARLRPGMYVVARISNQFPESWTLPSAAVVRQDDAFVCFRVENGQAVRTLVQVGRGDGQLMQVLGWRKAGAASSWEEFTGQEAVAAKASGLSDGQKVTPQTAK